jgi:2-oxoglutarate ferredoxin oxidoreductase subunit alpha
VQAGQVAALRAGWRFGETTTSFAGIHETGPAPLPTGTHRSIRGSLATAYGLLAAAHRAGLPLFLGAYPGTPADEIRHELSKLTSFGVRPFQAEDEIAAAGAALGASFAGMLGATVTSGPGMALNAEMIAFGVSLELPLVVVNVQRGGPSADRSTKSEQADLLQALYGRNGESPVPVIAPRSPSDCFDTALEACRIALAYRTPVVLLSDTGLAHGCEPWRVPDVNRLPDLAVEFATAANGLDETGREVFLPYARDPRTLARPLGLPGTPGLQHRIGGLEEAGHGGGASGGPDHHDLMARTRQAKIDKIAVPALSVDDPSAPPGHGADILVLGWGSTYGPISAACRRVRRHGAAVAQAHLRHINPLPPNTASVLSAYETVLVPEMNTGQLASLLRASCLVDTISHTPTGGLPFHAAELEEVIMNVITGGTFS